MFLCVKGRTAEKEPEVQEYAADALARAAFAEFWQAAQDLGAWAAGPEAAGLQVAALEREVTARGAELMRLALQGHLDVRAAREQRLADVRAADGSARPYCDTRQTRQLATVCGQVTVTRRAYRRPGAAAVFPADEQLHLPGCKYSPGLAQMAARAVAGSSYEAAAAQVAGSSGVVIGARQLRQLTGEAAADFDAFYAARSADGCGQLAGAAAAGGTQPAPVVVLEADGKGVLMRPGELRPRSARKAARAVPRQDGRLSRGEVRTRKRMAEAGAVFHLAPASRTAASVLALPGEPEEEGSTQRSDPRAQARWLTASLAKDTAEVIADVFAEADRRDPGHTLAWVALVDGNNDQIARFAAEAARRGITLPIIIDIIHVIEYLWKAAWCFFPEASPEAAPWVRARARAILEGRSAEVAEEIRRRSNDPQLSAAKRKAAGASAGYLQAKAPHLDYPTALASGWPISTGVIEGACRHLVQDRMGITGARWSTDGAEAVLKLRAIIANGDWDEYWAFHLRRQHERLYHRDSYRTAS